MKMHGRHDTKSTNVAALAVKSLIYMFIETTHSHLLKDAMPAKVGTSAILLHNHAEPSEV